MIFKQKGFSFNKIIEICRGKKETRMNDSEALQAIKTKTQPEKSNELVLWSYKLVKGRFPGWREEDFPEQRHLVKVGKKVYQSNREGVKLIQERTTFISMSIYNVLISFSMMANILQQQKEKGLLLKSPDEGIEMDVSVTGKLRLFRRWIEKHNYLHSRAGKCEFNCMIENLDLLPKREKKRRRED